MSRYAGESYGVAPVEGFETTTGPLTWTTDMVFDWLKRREKVTLMLWRNGGIPGQKVDVSIDQTSASVGSTQPSIADEMSQDLDFDLGSFQDTFQEG